AGEGGGGRLPGGKWVAPALDPPPGRPVAPAVHRGVLQIDVAAGDHGHAAVHRDVVKQAVVVARDQQTAVERGVRGAPGRAHVLGGGERTGRGNRHPPPRYPPPPPPPDPLLPRRP